MDTQKLSTTDAFVVRDLPNAETAVGAVRVAPKILVAGAKDMARSLTYRYALLQRQIGGASAGINAKPENRPDAIAAFVAEMLPAVSEGEISIKARGAVDPESLAELAAADRWDPIRFEKIGGVALTDRLTALGAHAAADEALGGVGAMSGASVVIEGFDQTGPTLAAAASAYGASIVGVSTPKGAITNTSGFDNVALTEAWAEHGADMVNQMGLEATPANRIFGRECDVFYAGSKMGVVSHVSTEYMNARVLVPTTPVPFTTKAMLLLREKGTAVLPDFLTTAGPAFAEWPSGDITAEAIEADATSTIRELAKSALAGEDGPMMTACYQAEAFLRTWQDDLPFGRPFAA